MVSEERTGQEETEDGAHVWGGNVEVMVRMADV